jgi:transposase
VESHPDALVKFFKAFGLPLTVIGLEAGPLSQWLYAGLTKAGFVTTLMETRHVNAALSATTVKTDRAPGRKLRKTRPTSPPSPMRSRHMMARCREGKDRPPLSSVP